MSTSKPVYQVSVRELVEFALRRGDLGGGGDFVGADRALAGTRGHQRLQRARPPGYRKEVALAHEVETAELVLRVQGRLDGLLRTQTEARLEEIKTVQGRWDGVADPLHWAQLWLYAFIYLRGEPLEHASLQLTYLNLDTEAVTEFRETATRAELERRFAEATGVYLAWIQDHHRWRLERDASLGALPFPYPDYRPGQRDLIEAAQLTAGAGGRLFIAAPTGIGKTVSVLFPALKALGQGHLERVFYLTARTVGRAVAEKALADLRQAGLRLRALTLTARDKLCAAVRAAETPPSAAAAPPSAGGGPCDMRTCPFALGYYDRVKPALREALDREQVDRRVLEEVARRHQVCPFELALDLSPWVDAVVADYNYVFDPKVYLRRHFSEDGGAYVFLVDEAHNLVDRARDMFSAELDGDRVRAVARLVRAPLPRCAKALARLHATLRQLAGTGAAAEPAAAAESAPAEPDLFAASLARPAVGTPQGSLEPPAPAAALARRRDTAGDVRAVQALPSELLPPLQEALREAEAWLAQDKPAEWREALLELVFHLRGFLRTAGLYDERYVTILTAAPAPRARLFCVDPSHLLRQAMRRGRATVFFSATLTPLPYYRALLGGLEEDPVIELTSPFPAEHLGMMVQDRIGTHLRAREHSRDAVVQAVGAVVTARQGNYLVYFSSYQYLNAVHARFTELHPALATLVQRPGMTEPEREAFLAAFAADHARSLVGFAVLGGVFGEGIDLVGERLIGAIVVGVGLPQLCLERDLIRDYFEPRTGAGFDYAYTFPGMNRVLQATGRVIRGPTDRGVVLLIDSRFGQARYRRLFPSWWRPCRLVTLPALTKTLARFWDEAAEPGLAAAEDR